MGQYAEGAESMSGGTGGLVLGLYCLIGVVVLGIVYGRIIFKRKKKVWISEVHPLWARVVGSIFLVLGWPRCRSGHERSEMPFRLFRISSVVFHSGYSGKVLSFVKTVTPDKFNRL